jgi:hypothetical protein
VKPPSCILGFNASSAKALVTLPLNVLVIIGQEYASEEDSLKKLTYEPNLDKFETQP